MKTWKEAHNAAIGRGGLEQKMDELEDIRHSLSITHSLTSVTIFAECPWCNGSAHTSWEKNPCLLCSGSGKIELLKKKEKKQP